MFVYNLMFPFYKIWDITNLLQKYIFSDIRLHIHSLLRDFFLEFSGNLFCDLHHFSFRILQLTPIPAETILRSTRNNMQMRMHHHLPGSTPIRQMKIVRIKFIQTFEQNSNAAGNTEHPAGCLLRNRRC